MGDDNEDSSGQLWEPPEIPGSQGTSFAEGKPPRTVDGTPLTERKSD